jgi:zinc D-Ala-D-Ala carboxypeptidase
MKISEHLDMSEVIRSESAKRLGIKNIPTDEHTANLKVIAENIFEPIRQNFRVPIRISSAYRSAALNRAIGGATNSQHSIGEAIDIDMDGNPHGVTNKQIFDYIKNNLNFDQLIWEFGDNKNPDWIHVSYKAKGNQRKQVLVAKKINGKTTYTPYGK